MSILKSAKSLLLSPRGRIARAPFLLGVLALLALYAVQHFTYPHLGKGLMAFFVPMVFFFLNLHIIFCVFGKRLHDIGRSTWPLFGMFALLFTAMMIVGLKYGMLEYFEAVHALNNDPKMQEDLPALAAAIKPLEEAYQQTLSANMGKISVIVGSIPLVFTAWLALAKGQKADNRYGAAPA